MVNLCYYILCEKQLISRQRFKNIVLVIKEGTYNIKMHLQRKVQKNEDSKWVYINTGHFRNFTFIFFLRRLKTVRY